MEGQCKSLKERYQCHNQAPCNN